MQNYSNHTRYYPFHHFIVTPLTLIYFAWSVSGLIDVWGSPEQSHAFFHLLGAFIILLMPILSRIYAMKNQDRVIRLEIRQQYFELTGKSFQEQERKLRMSQIVALRFASNEEFIPLMEKTINDGLGSKEIKQQIINWKEDTKRV
ncbi:DUF6526 family protein [Mongoliitalea daihaiensis]|uniref:DUF6526 family protein n=1 Tax=Mongoliitalea daihaiensis TaxID=2782006 RepID=UPI001F21ED10|nr:DUF6526 family protein [Mongoliitalea daihaiensis]UJP63936.1 hypothetical protein IPZ59_14030 [Mongoliitalea daihaiensis]